MTTTESRLPMPPNGRSPADLTKKELVTHLSKSTDIPKTKLNIMRRDELTALFDLPKAEALAAIETSAKAHKRKQRKPKKTASKTAVYEHLLTGPKKA